MRKICVIIGSRANWGRLKAVCDAINRHPNLELQLITAASGVDLPICSQERVQCLVEGDNHQVMSLTAGTFLIQLGGILERLAPDVVLIHGDRYEMLSAAIATAYLNIPLAHTEGGEVTGCIDDKVRNAITSLADIHFPVTNRSAEKLISMGVDVNKVFTVGSTALDAIKGIDLTNNRKEPYIVVLHHPNTTKEEDITPLIEAVMAIPIKKVWVNPNVDPGSRLILKMIHQQDVEFAKNLSPEEYARLIYNCKCLVGNTSSGIKEGAFLGVPYVCVGDRQKGRENGDNVLFTDYDTHRIVDSIEYMMSMPRPKPDCKFGDGTASEKIVELLSKINIHCLKG